MPVHMWTDPEDIDYMTAAANAHATEAKQPEKKGLDKTAAESTPDRIGVQTDMNAVFTNLHKQEEEEAHQLLQRQRECQQLMAELKQAREEAGGTELKS